MWAGRTVALLHCRTPEPANVRTFPSPQPALLVEVMDIQGHTPFKARGGLGVAGYGLDMV